MSGPTTILTPFDTSLTIGTTAVIGAIPANPTRKALLISNNAPPIDPTGTAPAAGTTPAAATPGAVVYITFGEPNLAAVNPLHWPSPTTGTGIPIKAGETFSLFPYAATDISMGAQINMIATAASTPCYVVEF
jgi:hypothetical protein